LFEALPRFRFEGTVHGYSKGVVEALSIRSVSHGSLDVVVFAHFDKFQHKFHRVLDDLDFLGEKFVDLGHVVVSIVQMGHPLVLEVLMGGAVPDFGDELHLLLNQEEVFL
jgi:hypothetical protein